MEKAQMMEGVSQLSMADVLNLKQLIGLSSGAAAGAIIARFLLNRGLIGTLVGALAGGAVGGSLFGQRSSGSSTFLGQPLSF
jgi:ABC-type enterobactin transport system permease subunit